MKSEERTQMVYTADDGTEFLDEVECRKYETTVLERLNKMKFYRVLHCPDLTEGRGFQKATYFAVDMNYSHELAVIDWCEINFKSRVSYVQGCAPTLGWHIKDVGRDQWEKPVGVTWGGNKSNPDMILIAGSPVPSIDLEPHVWQKGGGFMELSEVKNAGD
jgi:hypothetical protein